MGGGAAEEPETHVVPRLEPILDHQRHEIVSLPIPDELMVDIFLRLTTPADLVRASAACVSFRRVAADRSFLRRYRKLHATPLLGFFESNSNVFHPDSAPHPSASAASAVALAADFSFSFLPAPAGDWVVQDIRDGRVLLDRPTGDVFSDMVVCDPLHRRYLLLPPIHHELVATVEDPKKHLRVDIFLVPPGNGEEEETSFRVIWMAHCKTRLVPFVFSSNTGQWRAIPSQRWSDLFAGLPPLGATGLTYSRQYVYDCFYWGAYYHEERKLLVLDTETMEFSIAELPPEAKGCCGFAMVEAGEGRPGMFVLAYDASDLSYIIRQNDGGSSSRWQNVKTISMGSGTHLICSMEKCFAPGTAAEPTA